MRRLFILLALSFICTCSFAQTKYFYGKLIDSITLLPVQDVQVMNLNTHESDVTNSKGLFVLKGSLNDTFAFLRVGYWQQHLLLSGNNMVRDTLKIVLIPKTEELKSVTVSAYSYADYQQDSTDRRNNFGETVGYAHQLFESSNSGAGLGFSLDRIFDRKQKNKRNAYKFFAQNEDDEYINFRFNPIIVHSLTGFRGDSLQAFMFKYQPTYQWLRKHTSGEDILFYVNEKLKDYYHRK
ncbi:MAG TPA: hypothetical protein VGB84_09645 [Arachidicoccus sp.]